MRKIRGLIQVLLSGREDHQGFSGLSFSNWSITLMKRSQNSSTTSPYSCSLVTHLGHKRRRYNNTIWLSIKAITQKKIVGKKHKEKPPVSHKDRRLRLHSYDQEKGTAFSKVVFGLISHPNQLPSAVLVS